MDIKVAKTSFFSGIPKVFARAPLLGQGVICGDSGQCGCTGSIGDPHFCAEFLHEGIWDVKLTFLKR